MILTVRKIKETVIREVVANAQEPITTQILPAEPATGSSDYSVPAPSALSNQVAAGFERVFASLRPITPREPVSALQLLPVPRQCDLTASSSDSGIGHTERSPTSADISHSALPIDGSTSLGCLAIKLPTLAVNCSPTTERGLSSNDGPTNNMAAQNLSTDQDMQVGSGSGVPNDFLEQQVDGSFSYVPNIDSILNEFNGRNFDQEFTLTFGDQGPFED